ncbi:hypothetical protein [Streptomyces spongiicola]|uniref:hypothetical protein n=1 Tax=Streptomyces spongiicola TaxID=1690221 RepID=UPI0013A5B837|nr:hypothetical protein [Streptomyces spongiicola]
METSDDATTPRRHDAAAARLAPEVAPSPGLLPAIAELIACPVAVLSGDTGSCTDPFVLERAGGRCLSAIRKRVTAPPRLPRRDRSRPADTASRRT